MRPSEGGIEGIAAGTIVVGKYRIEAILGKGGMGTVYRAFHLALEEDVAIKVLQPSAAVDEETVQRFLREAQSVVKLKSEHVARVLDIGAFENDLPFMVMEFLQGADLGQMVDTHGAMTTPVAVDLVLQACDAVVEAHSLGIVHRDLKPSNLFVSFRPDQSAIVKVLDFGISKSANQSDLSLTQTQSMLGTPAYMSPEQMRSARSVDARTDIWSIGTVLYELVEARRPFQAESFSEMCVMVAVDPPARMTNAVELEPIISRCLAKQPGDRYAHVGELMRDLSAFAGTPDAAARYVKRAYRTLGLAVPLSMDSSPFLRPSYPALRSTPTPTAVHDAASAAMAAAVAPATPTMVTAERTLQDPVRPTDLRSRESRGSRGLIIGLVLATLIGGIGALAYIKSTRAAEPTAEDTAVVTEPADPVSAKDSVGSAGSAGSAAGRSATVGSGSASVGSGSASINVTAGSAQPPIGRDAGSGSAAVASGSGSDGGSAATIAAKPRPTAKPARPIIKPRPPVKPPVVVKPPVTPPAKPKCDVFSAPRDCHS